MPKKGYDELVGRAVNNPKFRARLLKDPEGVIADEGFDVPADVIETLKNIDPDTAEAAIKAAEASVGDRRAAT